MRDPFAPLSDPRCQCPTAVDSFTALLHDETIAPCPLHQAAEVARAEANTEIEQRRSIVEELRVDDELARQRKVRENRLQALEEQLAGVEDPLQAAVIRATHRGSAQSLNRNLSHYESLRGFTPDDAA